MFSIHVNVESVVFCSLQMDGGRSRCNYTKQKHLLKLRH